MSESSHDHLNAWIVRRDEPSLELRTLREETTKKVRDLFVKKGTEIYRKLTPAQREEYRKLNDDRRARRKQPQQ